MGARGRRELAKRVYAIIGVAVVAAAGWWWIIQMPAKSFRGTPAPLSAEQLQLRGELAATVQSLAGDIGERNVINYSALRAAAEFIEQSFVSAGLHPRRDGSEADGLLCENIEAEIPGSGSDIVVVGPTTIRSSGLPARTTTGAESRRY